MSDERDVVERLKKQASAWAWKASTYGRPSDHTNVPVAYKKALEYSALYAEAADEITHLRAAIKARAALSSGGTE